MPSNGFWINDEEEYANSYSSQQEEDLKVFPIQLGDELVNTGDEAGANKAAVRRRRRVKSYKKQLLVQLRNALLQEARDKANRYYPLSKMRTFIFPNCSTVASTNHPNKVM
jgi:hypothetical protein